MKVSTQSLSIIAALLLIISSIILFITINGNIDIFDTEILGFFAGFSLIIGGGLLVRLLWSKRTKAH